MCVLLAIFCVVVGSAKAKQKDLKSKRIVSLKKVKNDVGFNYQIQ